MAQFFKAQKQSSSRHNRNAKQSVLEQIEISVDVIDHQGNGICLSHKPIVVIPAAIPDETYRVQILSKKQKVWHAKIVKVLKQNELARVKPFCPYVATCGGCSHQAYRADYLIEAKQASLATYLSKVIPSSRLEHAVWEELVKSDITDTQHGYRRRARLAIDARNMDDIKVGFRQEKSNKVVDIPACAVLTESLQPVYQRVVSVIKALPSAPAIGHITLTEGAENAQVSLHLTKSLDAESLAMLLTEQHEQGTQYVIESKAGKHLNVAQLSASVKSSDVVTVEPFTISDAEHLNLSVTANNFIQVNRYVNQQMLALAKEWLEPTENDVLVDLFSGIGNFSLYLAPYCEQVIGVEGVAEMVQQADANAHLNGIDNCRFEHYDLNNLASLATLNIPEGALFVIDPSRAGALEIMQVLAKFKPKKIVYVSCNPNSFARDVDVLPSKYEISKMRALDMFPFTKHIEMMALISAK